MKTTAIVPVYNEEKTVEKILKILDSHSRINKIIVVDDCSTDDSLNIIKKFVVKIISLDKNGGKGGAVKIASKFVTTELVLLLDADLIGLTHKHIDDLLDTAMDRRAAMVIGLKDQKNIISNLIMPYFPLTGGDRVLLTNVFKEIIKQKLIEGWGIEYVMNDYCKKKDLRVEKIKLKGLNHIGLQTKKYGLGVFIKQIYEVVMVRLKLFGVKYP